MQRGGERARDIARLLDLVSDMLSRFGLDGDNKACKPIYDAVHGAAERLYEMGRKADDAELAEVESRHGRYTDAELRYAATARCNCGAGLAYHKRTSIRGQWECSDILTGRALPASHPESKEHTPPLPFAFYEVKSEDQPNAQGHTTRPKPAE